MRRSLLAAPAAIALSAAALQGASSARAADYPIAPSHTHILFTVNHLGFSNMIGLFTVMGGTFSFDPANVEASKVKVTIKTDSLSTQFGPRDADLKGADWFNVTEFPEMTFTRAALRPTDKKQAAGFSATGKLKRSEFGMKTYIPYIGDDVSLIIETEGTY